MNYFHLEAKVISRGARRSAVASSAYASCSELYNDYDGVTHDYRKKTGLVHSEVMLPPMTPAEWADREKLWNAVEKVEKTRDSRLSRELVVALPRELDSAVWVEMLEKYLNEECVSKGMCADFSIHDVNKYNPHAHIMLTMRPLNDDGSWQAKTQKEYVCYKDGVEKGFTADEFKTAKDLGWEKQYLYSIPGKKKKIYLTPAQAATIEGSKRTSKYPKSSKYGRQNPICEEWNSDRQLQTWRKSWEDIINSYQERYGISDRVSCKSHAARGIKEQPTIHEGYYARNMEKEGLVSDRCEINRQIKSDNSLLRKLQKEVKAYSKAASDNIPAIASKLERFFKSLVVYTFQLHLKKKQKKAAEKRLGELKELKTIYEDCTAKISSRAEERKEFNGKLKNLKPYQKIQFIKYTSQVALLTEEIEEFKSERSAALSRYGMPVETRITDIRREIKDAEGIVDKLGGQIPEIKKSKEDNLGKYKAEIHALSSDMFAQISEERTKIHDEHVNEARQILSDSLKKSSDKDLFAKAIKEVDATLSEIEPSVMPETENKKKSLLADLRADKEIAERTPRKVKEKDKDKGMSL